MRDGSTFLIAELLVDTSINYAVDRFKGVVKELNELEKFGTVDFLKQKFEFESKMNAPHTRSNWYGFILAVSFVGSISVWMWSERNTLRQESLILRKIDLEIALLQKQIDKYSPPIDQPNTEDTKNDEVETSK